MANEFGTNAIKILQQEQDAIGMATVRTSKYDVPEVVTEKKVYQDPNTNQWVKEESQVKTPYKDDKYIAVKEQEQLDAPGILRQPCEALDRKILAFNVQINGLKAQIASLSAEATAGNCWPGIALTTVTVDGSFPDPPVITQVAYNFASFSTIKEDAERVKIFPKIAGTGQDFTTPNPFAGVTTVTLDASYVGYGYSNYKADDYGPNVTTTGRFDISATLSDHQARTGSSGGLLFDYKGAGVAPYATNISVTPARCVAIRGAINTLLGQITEIRSQRDSIARTDLNTLKDVKSEKELIAWGVLRKRYTREQAKTQYNAAIDALGRIS